VRPGEEASVIQYWLADSLRRFYPLSPAEVHDEISLRALRGERVSFQMVCRTDGTPVTIGARVEGPDAIAVRVRRIGFVPMPHLNTETPDDDVEGRDFLPGYVPDPLFSETTILAGPHETNAFWVSVAIPDDAAPGEYRLHAVCAEDGQECARLSVILTVHPAVLPVRHNFPVTNWLYADAIADWYRVDLWDEPFWRLLDPYLRNLAAHGQDTIYVPLFTPPLDGIKRPTQLLGVEPAGDGFAFDWTQVRRWLQTARAAGFRFFEWTHLFSQWGAAHALRIYRGHGESGDLLWDPATPATADVYRGFLGAFLPDFERFLRAEGIIEQSFFHLSDEPHGAEHLANYRAARELLRQLAPWMRIMDAMSDVAFAREGLTDTPVALLPQAPSFVTEGFPAWAYFCCQPRGRFLNRLFDTPLAKIRMSGWLFYRTGAGGFLHWAANYWYRSQTADLIDPFRVADAARWPVWPYGDPFVLYPGPAGPLDSIRWEVFAESLQDYAVLQAAAVDRADPLLRDIQDFAEFPRDPGWVGRTRNQLLDRLS
jgi:hypothetical protein